MKKIVATLLALVLFPLLVLAADELRGTVVKVDKAKNQIVVQTEKGEETLQVSRDTKGMEHAKQGAKVTLRFSEKNGQPNVTEIIPGA